MPDTEYVLPAIATEAEVIVTDWPPLLEKLRVKVPAEVAVGATDVPLVRLSLMTCACALLVLDPNRPNMYPATAAKAMRVAAMMRTVAMIGEIPFLCRPDIFIGLRSSQIILTVV